MAEKRVTMNEVEIVKNKCRKETGMDLSFDVVKEKGTSYKIIITIPGYRNRIPLFGGQRFTTREAKAMFNMLRMVRQLGWAWPTRLPILKYNWFEGDNSFHLNELNIPG
jgi:hypothetical protein